MTQSTVEPLLNITKKTHQRTPATWDEAAPKILPATGLCKPEKLQKRRQ